MLSTFHDFGCNMNVKLRILYCRIDAFSGKIGKVSDVQGERIHQQLKTMEERYLEMGQTYDSRLLL